MNSIAETNFLRENSSTGIGGGPTPLACTCLPQNGWSPKKGTTVVGHWNLIQKNRRKRSKIKIMKKKKVPRSHETSKFTAALRPAAVVPAPP